MFVPRAFQPEGDSFDARFRFLGPVLGTRADGQWAPPDPARPLLYVSLGSIFTDRPDLYRTCVTELGLGRRLDPGSLTADGLRGAVEEVVASPAVRTGVDRMRAEARDGGGASGGTDPIDHYLS